MTCPLCLSEPASLQFERQDPRYGQRIYFLCDVCGLVFLDPALHLDADAEKARYDSHQNNPADEGYRDFLRRLADPLSEKLRKGDQGLDFGCGPGPTLSLILSERGFEVANYDPFYFPDSGLLKRSYDFVTSTEVVEHLYHPRDVFLTLDQLLKPNGHLGMMTEMLDRPDRFANWWYHRDPTHVCFYQKETFHWIAGWRQWNVEFPRKNVVIYKKTV